MGWRLAIVLLLVLIENGPAAAIDVEPFYTRNQSPLVQIFGLPPAEGGALTEVGRSDARLVLDLANVFTGDENDNHRVSLDGEIYRLTLALRHGIGQRLEIGLDIPYVWHSGGGLDSFIDGFHRTFSLPEGGRDESERDQLSYVSASDGETLLLLEKPQDGFGDLLLSLGLQLWGTSGQTGRALALRGTLKLPTGDSDKLTGSGSTDVSLRLAFSSDPPDSSFGWYGALGAMWMSDGEVLENKQRDAVGFGTLGWGWTPYEWLALKLQFDGHTPFYRGSALCQEDDPSVQIVVGLAADLPAGMRLDFGVVEDLVVDTSPDVVFHLALGRRF